MKTVGLREAKASLSEYVATAQHERVILTRHGKPVAVVVGVEGRDLEDVLLTYDQSFWKLVRERRTHPADITLAEARRQLGVRKKPARKKPRKA